MIPLGFRFLTQMIITVSTSSGVLQILNDEVLNQREFLWKSTVMKMSKQTQISISGILLKQSYMQRGALGPVNNFQVSSYWGHSTPITWTILQPHHVQNDTRKVYNLSKGWNYTHHVRDSLWNFHDTERHTHFTHNVGSQHKEGTSFLPNPNFMI